MTIWLRFIFWSVDWNERSKICTFWRLKSQKPLPRNACNAIYLHHQLAWPIQTILPCTALRRAGSISNWVKSRYTIDHIEDDPESYVMRGSLWVLEILNSCCTLTHTMLYIELLSDARPLINVTSDLGLALPIHTPGYKIIWVEIGYHRRLLIRKIRLSRRFRSLEMLAMRPNRICNALVPIANLQEVSFLIPHT